jgi:L-iditol 2-dehydrogenase
MKAVRLNAIGSLNFEERPKPVPGPGDLLVRVEACGLCGSDRHMLHGDYPTALPVTLGHEFAGIVEAKGADVTRIALGARVTGDPNISCGVGRQCRIGRVNLCEKLSAIGVQRDGGFAEYVLVPQSQAIELPIDLNPLHGAFCEPLACCLHGLDVARIKPGDSVAVLGGGVIGLLMVQLARLAGATTVILSTRQKPRRELAEKLGATATVDPRAADPIAAVAALVPGGVDVVLECAGVPDTFTQALKMARRGGAVVIFGVMPRGQEVAVMPFDLLVNELRLESAYLNPLTHGRAAAMVASGVLDLDSLVTQTIGLAELPAILLAPPGFGDIKTIVVPSRG